MNSPSKIMFRGACLLALCCAISIFSVCLAPAAFAADAMPRTLSVSGEGKVMAKSDQAQLSAGVVTQAPTAAAALATNSAAMNKVFATLKAFGIPENKIQTSNFSVTPQYPLYSQSNPQPRRITGYEVSNQVTVIVDDLGRLGPALDALVRSGVNQLDGVSFSIANPAQLEEKARRAAVADAIAKAKGMAQAAGIVLGPILSLEEGINEMPRPMPMLAMRANLAAQAPPPMAEGEQTVSASVTIVYLLQ